MIRRIREHPLTGEAVRFLLTGGLNTALTIALYQLVVTYLSPTLSYAIAWVAGFIFVAVAYPKFVFRAESSSYKQSLALLIFYLFSFFAGTLLTWGFDQWGINKRLSIFLVVAITASINFVAGKFLYGNKCKNARA